MKNTDYLKQIRGKTAEQLDEELAALRKEQFNLRMQAATAQQTQTHLRSEVRRKIARIGTVLKEGVLKQQAKTS